MRRGDLYRVRSPRNDTKAARVFLVVSRQPFIDSRYTTVACIPVYSNATGVPTEVPVGPASGLRHESVLRCDEITSIEKSRLTDFVGTLPEFPLRRVSRALAAALAIHPEDIEDL